MLGENGKRWKGASPSPSIGHQAMEPSIGHQVGIFFHLPPSPCFEKGEFGSFRAFFPGHNVRFEFWEYLFPQPSLRK